MKTLAVCDTVDLWEAWIDLESTSEKFILYVVGDIQTNSHNTSPVLLKKHVQGAAASHLFLEVFPGVDETHGRIAEVGYAEPVADIYQYQQISICSGEEVIARIPQIELFY